MNKKHRFDLCLSQTRFDNTRDLGTLYCLIQANIPESKLKLSTGKILQQSGNEGN